MRLRRAAEKNPVLRPLVPDAIDIPKLRKFAEDRIEAAFERVEGVSNSNVFGGEEPECQVIVDPQRLAARGLTIADLRRVLQEQNKDTSAGDFWEGKRRYVVRTLGQFRSPEQVETQILTVVDGSPVRIRDVAEVRLSHKKPEAFVRRYGTDCLAINAQREVGANVLDVMTGLQAVNERLNDGLLKERGLVLTQVYDETEYIYSAVGLVTDNIYIGGVLTILVLLGKKLLPNASGASMPSDLSRHARTLVEQYRLDSGVFQLRVRDTSPLLGKSRGDVADMNAYPGLTFMGLQGGTTGRPLTRPTLEAGDFIVVRGEADAAARLAADMHLGFGPDNEQGNAADVLFNRTSGLAEVVIPPRSAMIGTQVFPGMVTESGDLVILAIQRNGEELRDMLWTAAKWPGHRPIAVRYPRSAVPEETVREREPRLQIGRTGTPFFGGDVDQRSVCDHTDAGMPEG